jgi:hypothetical protein
MGRVGSYQVEPIDQLLIKGLLETTRKEKLSPGWPPP